MRFSKGLLLLALFISLFSCHNNIKPGSTTFELSGTLTGGGEGIYIYLDRILPDTTIHLDSTKLDKDGKFDLHTPGIYKGFYVLRLTKSDFATLILDSTEKVTVTGNSQFLGNTYRVSGSEDSKLFWELNQHSTLYAMRTDSMQKRFQALINVFRNNQKKIDSLSNRFQGPYDSMTTDQDNYVLHFIQNHPSSFACLAGVQQIDAKKHFSYFLLMDSALMKAYPNSIYINLFHTRVTVMKRLAIGAMAPDFTMADPDGKNVSLSDFKGKIVLLHFWGSWCQPCFETMPALVKLYDRFKNKGFTILSVAIDNNKDQWIDAIKKHNMTWPQVSDLKYGQSPILQLYNIRKPPYTVLVSADGRILDKNLDESNLEPVIDSLLRK